MTTGVEIEMSRERNAFPRCHASLALKWVNTREASALAMISSCRMEGETSNPCQVGDVPHLHLQGGWDWPHYLCHAESLSGLRCRMLNIGRVF